MARFDVYELRSSGGLAVDVQADLLGELRTRLIVPLLDGEEADWPFPRLAPRLDWQGKMLTVATPFMSGVPLAELRGPVGSLVEHEYTIAGAIDLLLAGV
jgi:toxin CcdB